MAPVTILAPNTVAGVVARRHLAAAGGIRSGVAGLEVTTLTRLAERLATPALAPRRPATHPIVAAAWRSALADVPGQFREIAGHPATVRALTDAHVELRDLSARALEAVRVATPLGADLVALHQAVTSRTRDAWYDTTDVLTTATGNVTARLGACVFYLPQALTRAEAGFVTALAGHADLTIIAAMTGAKRADEAVRRSLDLLGLGAEMSVPIPTASRVINASDSDDEVRCVVRDLVDTLRTTPAHRVAVLYGAAEPYARLLHEHLADARITVNGPGTRPTTERAVARTLLDVLALADDDVPRADLFRALANAPVRDFTGERIPLSQWERTSREAGVVAGHDWQRRLDTRVAGLRAEAEAEAVAPEPRQWLIDRRERECVTAAELGAFANRLRAELSAAAVMTTWRDLAAWCLRLFTTLVGDDDALLRLPADEQYAAATVVSLLRGLDGLDAIGASAGLDLLRDVLDLELARSLPRVGRFGEGVLVAPLSAAVGLNLHVAFVVGLSEDIYPGRLQPDPLLPERARVATGGELRSSRERLHAQYRHLLAAFAVATETVVSFPRGDLRRSSHRLPSRWLVPSLRELSGDKDLSATDWDQPVMAGIATSSSFAGELLHTRRLATEQEWRTRQMASGGPLVDGVVAAGIDLVAGRASAAFTRFDGNLTGVDGLPDYATGDPAVSPTTLESYAICPHAFFVERLLGVRPLELPEETVVMSPMDIGSLMHEALDELVRTFAGSLPGYGQPWSDVQRARLPAIVGTIAADYERKGLTGHPRLWVGERRRILADAAWMLADDDAWRADVNARVVASEMPFGMQGRPPVDIAVPGGTVRMRGSADKVDVGRDGVLYVTDLKTGSNRSFTHITQDDPLVGGTKLQLPVYAFAARHRYGAAATPVHAAYWFVRKDRGRKGITLTPEVADQYAVTLSVLVRSIARGLFPLRAPDKPDYAFVACHYCNPDGIGHAENRERWERKRHDGTMRGLVEIIEPDALTGDAP